MNNSKSTSIHNLNADLGLSKLQKLVYLFLNWVNNLLPYYKVDPRIQLKDPGKLNWRAEWGNTYASSSAARKACDLFWRSLPWDQIKAELGEIHIFDTGCGRGNYSVRLQEGSRGKIASYTGVDHKRRENWDILEETHPNFHFVESSSNDILSLAPSKSNLFITQSAIEHFDKDLMFFEQIREFINKSQQPVFQIHLFPGAATLPLYLLHGLRQYTPRTISKITRLFGGEATFELWPLGGKEGKKIHWHYFTWPVMFQRKFDKPTFDEAEYEGKLRKALEYDFDHPSKSPLFWALIIRSYPTYK